ncbi:TIGR03943 family putative permease subunit [Sutcliffiella cohnii]|uniref:TIGR03943 family putative permease subunit n=1 Tax=Sutcliffiella cohnii TaxID=33932 RepID=UPI0008320F0F|nr:TIGR03943 family protein [Sutcliffiella cohnii]
MEQNRDYSFHIYIRGIILLGFTLLFFKLIVSGDIINFIAPRMMPFMYFAVAVLFILGIQQIWRSGSKKIEELVCNCGFDHGGNSSPIQSVLIYSLFIFPIVTGFMFSDNILDSSIIDKRGFTSSKKLAEERQEQIEEFDTSRAERYLEDPEAYMESLDERLNDVPLEHPEGFEIIEPPEGFYEELKVELLNSDTIVVDDDRYIPIMNIVDMSPEEFVGKRIEMIGFVYREPDFTENQFVVARFGLSCCVADAGVYGTLSNMPGGQNLELDEWVSVSGVLEVIEYNGWILPYIQVDSLEKIEQPKNPYIYEYY